jgi:hypothetical protein
MMIMNEQTTGDAPPALTLEVLEKAIDAMRPTVYYATEDSIEPGTALMVPSSRFSHECFVFNSGDFEKMDKSAINFVHLRDAPMKRSEHSFEIRSDESAFKMRPTLGYEMRHWR